MYLFRKYFELKTKFTTKHKHFAFEQYDNKFTNKLKHFAFETFYQRDPFVLISS